MKLSEINKEIISQIKRKLKLLDDAKFVSTPKKGNVISYTITSKFGVTLIDVHYVIVDDKEIKIAKIVDVINGDEEVWRDGTIYKIMNDIKGWYYSYSPQSFVNTSIIVYFDDHDIRIDKEFYSSYLYISKKTVAEIILRHYYKLYNVKK